MYRQEPGSSEKEVAACPSARRLNRSVEQLCAVTRNSNRQGPCAFGRFALYSIKHHRSSDFPSHEGLR